MNCKRCINKIKPGDTHCPSCGMKLPNIKSNKGNFLIIFIIIFLISSMTYFIVTRFGFETLINPNITTTEYVCLSVDPNTSKEYQTKLKMNTDGNIIFETQNEILRGNYFIHEESTLFEIFTNDESYVFDYQINNQTITLEDKNVMYVCEGVN